MFSYSIFVRKINNPKLKGVATVTIDDVMDLEGFKIIDGTKGLFVSVPSHKGTVVEDGNKVEKYFDDIRFKGELGKEFADELKSAIINAYNNLSDSNRSNHDHSATQSEAVAAKNTAAQASNSSSDSTPPRTRKPLWGF
jgi:DNA-binding cell septation regulator SpoVG